MTDGGKATAESFSSRMTGVLADEKVDAAVAALTDQGMASYYATGTVASLVFYLRFWVTVNPGPIGQGQTFVGNAGGLTIPGGGVLRGDVYTSDINRLYRETVSFEFQSTPVYASLLFFNGSSDLLGHYQSAAFASVTGVGGGSGSWSYENAPKEDDSSSGSPW